MFFGKDLFLLRLLVSISYDLLCQRFTRENDKNGIKYLSEILNTNHRCEVHNHPILFLAGSYNDL